MKMGQGLQLVELGQVEHTGEHHDGYNVDPEQLGVILECFGRLNTQVNITMGTMYTLNSWEYFGILVILEYFVILKTQETM